MRHQVAPARNGLDELLDVAQIVVSDRLDKLGNVEENRLGRIRVEHPGGVLGGDGVDGKGALAEEGERPEGGARRPCEEMWQFW